MNTLIELVILGLVAYDVFLRARINRCNYEYEQPEYDYHALSRKLFGLDKNISMTDYDIDEDE